MKLLELLSKEIDKQLLLNYLYQMDYDKEDAIEELKSLLKYIKSLPPFLTLYRIVRVDNESDIDQDSLGSHYSTNKKDLINNNTYADGYGEKRFLIKVKSPRELVDINQTLANNILYPNENEITLKNKGKGVKILSITELN
jgi:hypothetical protein